MNHAKTSLARTATRVSAAKNWRQSDLFLPRQARVVLPRAQASNKVQVGQTLGHYRLLQRISRGGMGVVYQAQDEHLEREVAVKVLVPDALYDPGARKRFRNEALALSKLNHPNIVSVYDFDAQCGVDFLVMEYVHGQTLAHRLDSGPLAQEEVLRIGRQIAAAVQEAHEHGIIHRDLKPQNVMLTSKGQVKVADFGLAKVFHAAPGTVNLASLTRDLEVVGTLPYMPPEQLRGEPADCRSDIYSAGALIYELATGQRAFPQRSGPQLVDSILHDVPRSPRTMTRWVSSALDTILVKCLEKDPQRRYQSAAELGLDLQHLSASSPGYLGIDSNYNVIGWPKFLQESAPRVSRSVRRHLAAGRHTVSSYSFLRRVRKALGNAVKTISGPLSTGRTKVVMQDDFSRTQPARRTGTPHASYSPQRQFCSKWVAGLPHASRTPDDPQLTRLAC